LKVDIMQALKKRSKNIKGAYSVSSVVPSYNVKEAIEVLQKVAFTKFDSTLEIALKLGTDPKQTSQVVRGVVSLPAGTGRSVRVAVVCKPGTIVNGADVVGGIDLIDEIADGNINFDFCIATPDMMGLLGKVAKILGPKGLMPNPKLGTVTLNVDEAVRNAKAGRVEFRSDKGGAINSGVGKLSFSIEGLIQNITAFVSAVIDAKPSGVKGEYLRHMYLSSTMGPSLRVSLEDCLSLVSNSRSTT